MLTNAEKLRKELLAAISIGNFQKVEKCVEEAESENIKNEVLNSREHDINPLRLATQKRNLRILRFLIAKGGDINVATSTVCLSTPLHIAAADDEVEIAQFLLDNGANINATNYKGFTPLYLASFYCHPDMVKLLFFNNANTNIKDINGKTALDAMGGYRRDMCDSNTRQEIVSILQCADKVDCRRVLVNTGNLKVLLEADDNFSDHDVANMASNAVRPSSFINSVFSWMGTSTTAALSSLFQSAPALPSTHQSVDCSAESPIGSSQVDCNGTVLLTAIAISKFTGKKYSMPLDDSLLTLEQIKERRSSSLEETLKMVNIKFIQCPKSLLSNTTISQGIHQKSL